MYRKILILSSLLLLAVSCSNDDNNGDIEEYQFYQNSRIVVNEFDFAEIENGNNLVFEYRFIADDEPNIADDEYSERIIFEIDSSADSFSLTNEELATANTYFDKYCFCFIDGSIAIENGTLTGTRVNENRWEVNINVSFMDFDAQTRTVSGTFRLSSP